MRNAGQQTFSSIGGSRKLVAWADIWYGSELLVSGVPINSGQVEFDISQNIASKLDITFSDSNGQLAPLLPTDALAPYGQEININMGIASGSEEAEPISIGWFRIQEPEINQRWFKSTSGTWRSGGASIKVTALDRMSILADARLMEVTQPIDGSTLYSEIRRMLANLVPMGTIDASLSNAAVPESIVYDQDRVKNLGALASALGGVMKIDSNGYFNINASSQYGDPPVWTFTAGEDGSIIDYTIVMTRDGVYNSVMVTGEANSDLAPVSGIAYDLDSKSPSHWGGPFGQVPLFYSSPLLTTAEMAADAARTRLNNILRGRDREYTFTLIPNHLIEIDDPILVELPDRIIPGRVTKLTLPLTPGPMSLTMRALDSSIITMGA